MTEEEKRKKACEYQKKLREYRKANRICMDCQKPLEDDDNIRCKECLANRRIINKFYVDSDAKREACRRYRQKKIDAGLCFDCGNKIEPESPTKYYCLGCRDKRNARYRSAYAGLLEIGICPKCGKTELQKDETICPECAAYRYEHRRIYKPKTEEQLAKDRVYQKNLRERRKQNNECTKCGKKLVDKNYSLCIGCREYYQQRDHNKNGFKKKATWRDEGLCSTCGAECKPGYKVCEKHYDILVNIGRKADKTRQRESMRIATLINQTKRGVLDASTKSMQGM